MSLVFFTVIFCHVEKKYVILHRNFAFKTINSFKTYDESVRDRFHYDSRFV